MKKKLISVLLCAVMACALLAGCGSSDDATEEEDTTSEAAEETADDTEDSGTYYKIGVAMKTQDGPYFVSLAEQLCAQCEALGLVESADDVVVLNANMDTEEQSANFETFITEDYDLIFCDCIDPDTVIADAEKAMDAGIPVIFVDSGVNEWCGVTTVYSDNEQNGRACGLSFAEYVGNDYEIYAIVLSGEKGNVAGTERRQGLICGIVEYRYGITEEEAWELTAEIDDELLSSGSYDNDEIGLHLLGQGWGNWTTNDIMDDASDLVVKYADVLNVMFAENDQMMFGGIQAAENNGLTDIYYVAAADGAQEAYDYINGTTTTTSGTYYCSGENSPTMVATLGVEIAVEILVDGTDWSEYEEVTLTDAVCVTAENVDEHYDLGF